MSVEQHSQQLKALELTKCTNSTISNSATSTNSNSCNNNDISNANNPGKPNEHLNDTKHKALSFHKIKEESVESPNNTPSNLNAGVKQNGQHLAAETNGENLKVQTPTTVRHHENSKEEKTQKEVQPHHLKGEKENDLSVPATEDNQHSGSSDSDDNTLNTACIIKTPLNKTLLKKCTPNGNGNLNALHLATTPTNSVTCCCNSGGATSQSNEVDKHQDYVANDHDDAELDKGNPFTKVPIPTTSSMSATTTSNASIKCTKCNNNNNIHYNNYNCYYRKKAARLKPSICR